VRVASPARQGGAGLSPWVPVTQVEKRSRTLAAAGLCRAGRTSPTYWRPRGHHLLLSNRHFVSVRSVGGNYEFRPLTPLSTNSSYIGLSGTSMAAPTWQVRPHFCYRPIHAHPERIKEILLKTATPLPALIRRPGGWVAEPVAALKVVPQVVVDTVTSQQADLYQPSGPGGAEPHAAQQTALTAVRPTVGGPDRPGCRREPGVYRH